MIWSRAAIGVSLLVAAFAFSGGCSWRRTEVSGEWKDDRGALRQWVRRSGRSYKCYFVTITGQGISPDYGPGDLGTRDPSCMGLGINSKSVSLTTVEETGVKFRIPSGPKRKIRVIGVRTTLDDCSGLTVKELFERRPGFYELGVGEEDAFIDKKVSVQESADVANATDIVAPCDNPEAPTLPATASAHRLVALLQGPPHKIRVFDQATGLSLTPLQDFPISGATPDILVATYRFRSVFATAAGPNFFYRRLNLNEEGTFESDENTHQESLPVLGDRLAFSSADDLAYVWDGIGGFTIFNIGTEKFQPHNPANCSFSNLRGFFSVGSFSYLPVANEVSVVTVGNDGHNCYALAGTFSTSGNFLQHREGAGGVHYVLSESTNNLMLQAFRRDATSGGFGDALSTASYGGITGEFVVSKDGKYIFANDLYQNQIFTYDVLENGTISPVARVLSGLMSPRKLRVSYDGKVLYFVNNTGDLLRYEISSSGALSLLQASGELENSGEFMDVVPVPIF